MPEFNLHLVRPLVETTRVGLSIEADSPAEAIAKLAHWVKLTEQTIGKTCAHALFGFTGNFHLQHLDSALSVSGEVSIIPKTEEK